MTKSFTDQDRRARRWCFMDLVTDHQTGKLRETLVWSNIGKGAALWGFVYEIRGGTDSEWLWAIVMAVLTAHELFSRWLNQRLAAQTPTASPAKTGA